ncbi:hypothetical protein D4764_10G0007650 [Takifugu flavidus]|uniref:Uncharacterized protein n=1 Tax=Takifugu flavidus TaxID=433684 RepID=A0A5C6PJZ6_9TELE|nr:hypothetical protein D4764_10G0007650 [Takifugu flavidus]
MRKNKPSNQTETPTVLLGPDRAGEAPHTHPGSALDRDGQKQGHDIICQWIPYQAPWGSGLAQQRPEAPHQSKVVLEGDAEDKAVSQHSVSGCWWEGPEEPETQECVCQQREPERLGPSWPGCTYAYSGVRRNLLIGLEVVEEVAIEDTVELITDNIYTDHLQGQLYPPCSHLFQDPASPDLHSKSSTI